ncbi:hypothetical protein EPIB2_205 [Tritonibacter mobilis]|nr:hypothetical protein EPIB2_205 [Tritonibacter mobilis]
MKPVRRVNRPELSSAARPKLVARGGFIGKLCVWGLSFDISMLK